MHSLAHALMYDPDASPFNRLPPLVVAVAVLLAGIEGMFQLGELGLIGGAEAIGWRIGAIRDFGWHDQIFAWMIETGQAPWSELRRLLTFPLLHRGAVEALLAVVFVLALGKMVSEAFGQAAFVVVFALSSLAGALSMALFTSSNVFLVGGYPGAFGLIGAFTYLRYAGYVGAEASGARAFSLIAILAGVQLIFSLINADFGNLTAELGGFACGFLLSFIVRPGGLRLLLNRLRQR